MQVESENDSQSDKAESNRKKSPAEILGNMVYTATRKLGFPDTGSYAYGEFTDFCVDQVNYSLFFLLLLLIFLFFWLDLFAVIREAEGRKYNIQKLYRHRQWTRNSFSYCKYAFSGS